MNDNSNDFYDVKISRDIINEKERNNITDSFFNLSRLIDKL